MINTSFILSLLANEFLFRSLKVIDCRYHWWDFWESWMCEGLHLMTILFQLFKLQCLFVWTAAVQSSEKYIDTLPPASINHSLSPASHKQIELTSEPRINSPIMNWKLKPLVWIVDDLDVLSSALPPIINIMHWPFPLHHPFRITLRSDVVQITRDYLELGSGIEFGRNNNPSFHFAAISTGEVALAGKLNFSKYI